MIAANFGLYLTRRSGSGTCPPFTASDILTPTGNKRNLFVANVFKHCLARRVASRYFSPGRTPLLHFSLRSPCCLAISAAAVRVLTPGTAFTAFAATAPMRGASAIGAASWIRVVSSDFCSSSTSATSSSPATRAASRASCRCPASISASSAAAASTSSSSSSSGRSKVYSSGKGASGASSKTSSVSRPMSATASLASRGRGRTIPSGKAKLQA